MGELVGFLPPTLPRVALDMVDGDGAKAGRVAGFPLRDLGGLRNGVASLHEWCDRQVTNRKGTALAAEVKRVGRPSPTERVLPREYTNVRPVTAQEERLSLVRAVQQASPDKLTQRMAQLRVSHRAPTAQPAKRKAEPAKKRRAGIKFRCHECDRAVTKAGVNSLVQHVLTDRHWQQAARDVMAAHEATGIGKTTRTFSLGDDEHTITVTADQS